MPFKHKSSDQANSGAAATKSQSWRDVLKAHPAAKEFPAMSPDELRELGEDILKNGLKNPIVLWLSNGSYQVLDGCNRLDAMEAVGIVVIDDGELSAAVDVIVFDRGEVDPYAYVNSANILRRHLTAEKKRELITKLIKATPGKSDRQIAASVKASPTTVGTVRAKMETTGEVSKLDTRTDARGVKQPATKPARAAAATAVADKPGNGDRVDDTDAAAAAGEKVSAEFDAHPDEHQSRDQRDIKITGLESEIEELKAALQASKPDVITTEALANLGLPKFLEIMPPAWRQPLAAKVRRLSNPDAPEADFPETEILRRALSLVKIAPISAAVAASNEKEALAALQQLSAAIARGGRDLNEVAIIGSSAKREKPRAA